MELESWKELLLDLGRGNRLIHFKDSKSGSLDVVFPETDKVFALLYSGIRSKCSIPSHY